MGRVSVEEEIRIQTLHIQKLGRRMSLAKKRKISKFWAQLRLFANVVIKRGLLVPEKQEVVYQKHLVRKKTLQISVN